MYRIFCAIVVLLVLASGCGGSHSTPVTPPAPFPAVGSGNLGNANLGRLVPADNPDMAGVGGVFVVQGFTILDENQNAVSPSLGSTKLMGRLVDPGDDILAAKAPGLDGKYELLTNEPVTNARVQLEFRVQEDVDGDGEGNDTIVHTVPVQLKQGYISQLDMTISPGSIHSIDPAFLTGGSNPEPAPTNIEAITVEVERLDGNGEFDAFFALLPDGSLYSDDNNDKFIEPGIDTFWNDLDRDGLPDPEEADYGNFGMNNMRYVEGVVTSVNTSAQTLFLTVTFAETPDMVGIPNNDATLVGQIMQVRKQSYTVMEGMLIPGDPGINGLDSPEDIGFTDPFQIDGSLVGKTVVVQGWIEDNVIEAEFIFELSPEPNLDFGEF